MGAGPDQGLHAAPLAAVMRDSEVTLAFRAFLPRVRPGPGEAPLDAFLLGLGGGAGTAMDIDADGARLALLTYREVLLWERAPAQAVHEVLQGAPRSLQVPPPGAQQMEAVAFSADGAWLFVGAERGRPNSVLTALRLPP